MPGKQMAIDADLNAGLINDVEAKQRRQEIAEEADFYGSMDGASKFVRGDAIAGILITFLNIIAGIIVGVAQGGMDVSQPLKYSHYSPLVMDLFLKYLQLSSQLLPVLSSHETQIMFP